MIDLENLPEMISRNDLVQYLEIMADIFIAHVNMDRHINDGDFTFNIAEERLIERYHTHMETARDIKNGMFDLFMGMERMSEEVLSREREMSESGKRMIELMNGDYKDE